MRFRIIAGERIEYRRVASRKLAHRLADELAAEQPGVCVQVQTRHDRRGMFSLDYGPWQTTYMRNAGVSA